MYGEGWRQRTAASTRLLCDVERRAGAGQGMVLLGLAGLGQARSGSARYGLATADRGFSRVLLPLRSGTVWQGTAGQAPVRLGKVL